MINLILSILLIKLLTLGAENTFVQLGLVVLLLLTLSAYASKNKAIFNEAISYFSAKPIFLILGVVIVSCVIAFFNSLPLSQSISTAGKFVTMLACYVIGYICVKDKATRKLNIAITCAIIVHVIAAIIMYFLGVTIIIDNIPRPGGLIGRPSVIANIAVFGIFYFLGQYHLSKYNFNKTAYFTLIAICTYFILISSTLKNFLAILPGIVIYYYLKKSKHIKAQIVVATLLISILIYAAINFSHIGDRLSNIADSGLNLNPTQGERLTSSLEWRILQWNLLISDWNINYRYQGAGIGQVVNMKGLKTSSDEGFSAHSNLLDFWVELGPFLFLLFAVAHIKVLSNILRWSSNNQSGVSLFSIAIVLLIASLAGNVYYSAPFMYLFWLMYGMLAGLYRENRYASS